MKNILRFIVPVLKNRYLLALAAFTVWIIFFDENNLLTQWKRTTELRQLERKNEYYKGQLKQARLQLSNLQNDPVLLEKVAREKYFMKRDNEEVFVIADSVAPAGSAR